MLKKHTMRFRIDTEHEDDRTTLKVSGTLSGPAVDELDRICRLVDGPLRVDLGELMTVDGFGVAFLRHLAGNGARLEGASPYVRLLLDLKTA